MAEKRQTEKVLVQEHQRKADAVKIQEVEKYGEVGPRPGHLGELGGMQEDRPGRDDQGQHNDVIVGKLKVFLVYQVGEKIGKEK